MNPTSLEKKHSDGQYEEKFVHSQVSVLAEESTHWDAAFSKKTLRKVDFRVLPILAAVYSLAVCASVFDVSSVRLSISDHFPSVSTERILQTPILLVHNKIISKRIWH
jgi:hypothetical protein